MGFELTFSCRACIALEDVITTIFIIYYICRDINYSTNSLMDFGINFNVFELDELLWFCGK